MDDSAGLQLNIFSSGKLKKKFRPKYHSKKQRIKEKKVEKKTAPFFKAAQIHQEKNGNRSKSSIDLEKHKSGVNESKSEENNVKYSEKKQSSFPNKDIDRKRKSTEKEKSSKASEDVSSDHQPPPAKVQRTGPFISSLFKSNPDIPKVDSSSVQTIKEEVFTSKKFGDLPLSCNMITNLEDRMNMKNMTTVQQLAIPKILQGQDALVKSQTGSGKTLAYAVPIVQKLQSITPKIDRSHGPYAIVVVPTRELATQSYEVFMKVCKPFVYVVPGCLMGGEKRKAEKARIRRGINILVGTPGRLLDHLQNTHGLSVKHVQYLVLDEADRLLDMGYEKDVAQIVNSLNDYGETKRQTILLSATLTEGVERLAGISLSDPAHVSVSNDDVDNDENIDSGIENDRNENKESFAVPQELKQHFVITPCKLRLVTLSAFILSKCRLNKNKSKMIVFLSTQDSVEFHHKLLNDIFCKTKKKKIKSSKIDDVVDSDSESDEDNDMKSLNFDLFKLHGDMVQKERNEVFKKFSEISSGVLLCTDVAARGLDLPQVSWIVQYTTPGQTSDYIHRVGRTARVGSQGQSLLFLIPSEVNYIKQLNDKHISLKEMQMKNILESLMTVIEYIKFPEENKRQKPRMWEEAATAVHQLFETYVAKHPSMTELSRRAYQSFIRAYATYPSHMKHIFSIKKVHLGHLAKSFALREAPGTIGVVQAKKYQEDHVQDKKENRFVKKKSRNAMSEFSSGLESELGVTPRHRNKQKQLAHKKLLNERKQAKKLAKNRKN